MIHSIDNISHPVRDLGKAVEFYRDVLRLDLHFVAREVGWAEFDVGGGTLALREVKSGFMPSQSSICFLVTEIEEEVKYLRERSEISGRNPGNSGRTGTSCYLPGPGWK